ncbi:MAG: hypothetical protein ABEJ26_10255 [Halosimplex sp.]
MRRNALSTLCVVGVVLLAGCSGFGAAPGSDGTTTGDDVTTGTPTATETAAAATATGTATATTTATATGTATATATEAATATETTGRTTETTEQWELPEYPNGPLENKLVTGASNRIESVTVVGGRGSGDGADSGVDVSVTANTSMPDIDPAEHGTVAGEPFFVVYVDSQLVNKSRAPRFYEVDGPPLQRKGVTFEANGTFELTVPQAAFEARGSDPGEVELLVLLFDEDEAWDDVYGVGTVNATYAPDE